MIINSYCMQCRLKSNKRNSSSTTLTKKLWSILMSFKILIIAQQTCKSPKILSSQVVLIIRMTSEKLQFTNDINLTLQQMQQEINSSKILVISYNSSKMTMGRKFSYSVLPIINRYKKRLSHQAMAIINNSNLPILSNNHFNLKSW